MTVADILSTEILAKAKWALTTRRVPPEDVCGLRTSWPDARPGDLILCEIDEIGQHKSIQLADRRVSATSTGDLVVLALGDCYAPEQFHAAGIIDGPSAQLVASGGVVGRVDAAHKSMATPTTVRPIAVLTGAGGQAINLASYALPRRPMDYSVTVIGVFGSSMSAGKTTAAASLAYGLRRAGIATAAIKATGTGASGDYQAFVEAGVPALDFTDVGMATTYRMPLSRIEEGFATLVGTCAAGGASVIICEIADGVFQKETREILTASLIRDRLDGILFAAPDALSALGGVMVMERQGLSPFAISGIVSLSPLASAEAEEVTGLPVLTREDLRDPQVIRDLVFPIMRSLGEQSAA